MKLVVVGGVAAGMSAAARARRLDENAEIIVLERGSHVSYANCGLPYYVGGEIQEESSLLVQTPQALKAALNLDVRTEHDVVGLDPQRKTVTAHTGNGPAEISYDELILAPGARAIVPPLPGVDSPRVTLLRTVPQAIALRERVEELRSEQPTRAVVLGAGFIGLEAAEALNMQGVEVTVVELAPHVLPPLEPEMASLVRRELQRLGITVHEGVGAQEIIPGDDHDVVRLATGEEIPADIIVMSVGVRPDTGAFESSGLATENGAIVVDSQGRTSLEHVWAAGDAVLSRDAVTGQHRPVPLAGPANRAGRRLADAIFGLDVPPIPDPLGTAIVRVGELTVATVGANRRALDAAGIEYHTIHAHPANHAGYFPGASQIHLVVHMSATDGQILGAQGVGKAGVDKRIDVFATAMRGKLSAADLIDLDLAYSPPYGSAKDPVNMVGMMAENLLTGHLKLWYPADLEWAKENALIVDVRSEAEFAGGHIEGAINIAHTDIRDQLPSILQQADGRPIRLTCASGMRSYLAYRILAQAGADVATLSGGMLTLNAALDQPQK